MAIRRSHIQNWNKFGEPFCDRTWREPTDPCRNSGAFSRRMAGSSRCNGRRREGDTDSVKCEIVRSFACGDRCKSVKVVHVSCDTAVTQRAVRFALQQIGKPFDADFDITDTTKYYCTKLVWQAYRHQHVDLSHGRRHHIQLLGLKKTCILPADLLP